MLEIIQQNPVISFLAFLVPVVAGTWKVMDILFLKPRDFRISVLEKNIDEIRKEIQRGKTDHLENVTSEPISETTYPKVAELHEAIQPERSLEKVVEQTTLLNDIDLFYETWWDRELTDLQRDQFEKSYVNQKVVWRAKLASVSEEKDGYFWVSLNSPKEKVYGVHVIAVFASNYKESLALINKGQIITVSGEIDSFSLSPLIKKCSIIKT